MLNVLCSAYDMSSELCASNCLSSSLKCSTGVATDGHYTASSFHDYFVFLALLHIFWKLFTRIAAVWNRALENLH